MKNLQQDKRVVFDYDVLFNLDNSEEELKLLTLRDVAFFASIAVVTTWRTRWLNVATSAQFDDAQAYASDAIERLFMTLDFCERVAECIRDNEDVQDALASQSPAGGTADTVINNTVYSSTVLIAENADGNGCTDNARYGRIVALVDYVDEVAEDFFESIDAATNVLAEIATLVSAIPLFETLPFDEIIATIANTGEQWLDSYQASVNTQLLESFYCKLWCQLQSCDVTVEDVKNAILERYNLNSATGTLNVITASALLSRIAATVSLAGGGTYIGDDFVYLTWLLQLSAVEATGEFFGVSIGDYVREAANGSPSGAHSGCNCPQPCFVYDFASGKSGWSAWVRSNITRATWVGDGWQRGTQTGGTDEIAITRPRPNATVRVKVAYENVSGTSTQVNLRILDDGGAGAGKVYDQPVAQGSGTVDVLLPSAMVGTDVVVLLLDIPQTGANLAGKITSIELCDV